LSEAAALIRFLKSNLGLPFQPIIAGGFARDQILGIKPRDIDVFLLAGTEPIDEATNYVIDRLNSLFIPFIVEPKQYATRNGIPTFGPTINFQFLSWPVQLIVTPCVSAQEVVESFDYNVCQFWLNSETFAAVALHDGHLASLVYHDMQLLHTRTPWSSLRRGILMSDRFGFKFHEQDKQRLIEALHAEVTS